MTTIQQVAHLVRKDLTEFRWWFTGYALLTLASTLTYVEVWKLQASESILGPMLWLIGGLIAARVVQADSPTQSRAFWASQPIDARVLLLSKVLVIAGTVLVLPLVGQFVVLQHYRVGSANAASFLVNGTWMYGLWLLLAMVTAAFSKRLAEFLGVFIVVPVVLMLLGNVLTGMPFLIASQLPSAPLALLTGAAATAMLVLAYRRRSAHRAWLVGAAAVVSAGLTAYNAPTARAAVEMAAANVPAIHIAFDSTDLGPLQSGYEQALRVTGSGMLPQYRYWFYADSAFTVWENGRRERLILQTYGDYAPQLNTVAEMFGGTPVRQHSSDAGHLRAVHVAGAIESLAAERVALASDTGRLALQDGEVAIEIHGGQSSARGPSVSVTQIVGDTFDPNELYRMRRRYSVRRVLSDQADTADVRLNQFSYQQTLLMLPGAKRVRMDWSQDAPRSVQRPQASPPGTRLELLRWNVVARYPMSVERVVP